MDTVSSGALQSPQISYTPGSGAPKAAREGQASPQENLPSWKTLQAYKAFDKLLAADKESGALTASGKALIEAFLNPQGSKNLETNALRYEIKGIEANDMFIISREPFVWGETNIVLYKPENNGRSFHSFKSNKDLNKFHSLIAQDTVKLNAYLAHFDSDARATVRQAVEEWSRAPAGSKLLGTDTSRKFEGNVFEGLERVGKPLSDLPSVTGLTDIQRVAGSHEKGPLFIGVRPSGEKVVFRYDASGNFLGAGSKNNFYFVRNALGDNKPLIPMTLKQFDLIIKKDLFSKSSTLEVVKNGVAELMERPFKVVLSTLILLGVKQEAASDIERYMNSPVSEGLLFLNKFNDIGKVFGISKDEMNEKLTSFGSVVQGVIPKYGWFRGATDLIAKAVKNEHITTKELKDAAAVLDIKLDVRHT